VLNGLLEISEASGHGFKIYEKELLIHEETRQICGALDVDPLRLLSSGSLLIVVDPNRSSELVHQLNAVDIPANVIGEITAESKVVVKEDGSLEVVEDVSQDELFRVLEETT
jgi:hydrogenase expression/formation protein HypE